MEEAQAGDRKGTRANLWDSPLQVKSVSVSVPGAEAEANSPQTCNLSTLTLMIHFSRT